MSSLKRKASSPSPLNVGHMYPSMAGGFGLVEILVGMAILGIAFVGAVRTFGYIQDSQTRNAIAVKNLAEQTLLDRGIWTKYSGFDGAPGTCAISSAGSSITLYFSSSATCTSASAPAVNIGVRAVVTPFLSGATLSDYDRTSRQLDVTTSRADEVKNSLNAMPDKSRLHLVLIQSSGLGHLCSLNSSSQVTASGTTLTMFLSNSCDAPDLNSGSDRVLMPKYYVQYLQGVSGSQSSRFDGLDRFLY